MNLKSVFVILVFLFSIQVPLIAQVELEPRSRFEELHLFNDANQSSRIRFSESAKFASAASKIVGTYEPAVTNRAPAAIVKSAQNFLSLLSDDQRKRIVYELDSQERSAWTNLPARRNAGGIRLGDMTDDQVKAVCELMSHLLSPQGYEKMRLIMIADDQLLRDGKSRPGFGTEYFSVVLFGTPSANNLWAFQLDGHHIGLNVAVKGDQITIAPSFIGTQPVDFKFDGQEIRPMQYEVDAAFQLVNALDEEQFKKAVVSQKRGQILTGPGRDGQRLQQQGIACSSFNEKQKSKLMVLIASWVGNLPNKQAKQRMIEIESEIDQMVFAWHGFRKPGSDVSYSLQSPSLIIEFAFQDLGGNPLNHLHTQYRNPKNEYGERFVNQK